MMNMQAGIPKAQLMAGDAMNRALTRMAHSGGRSGYCHVPRRPRSGAAER